MKNSLIVTICFFFLFHSQDFWTHQLDFFIVFMALLLLAAFLFVVGAFLNDLFFSFREKFQSRERNTALIITTLVLGLTVWKPTGLVKQDLFPSESILEADREGAANCNTTLKLKKDGTFSEISYCFGMTRKIGVYRFKNDTIWFKSNDEYYEFAIIGPSALDPGRRFINLYENKQDTLPYSLWIKE